MSRLSKPRLAVASSIAAVMLGVPTAAQATLVFTRTPLHPVVWAANDDGSDAKPIGKGSDPHVSPDGTMVAYIPAQKAGRGYRQEMAVLPTDGGGKSRVLLSRWSETFTFAWSPDSATIAAVTGPEPGKKSLVAIEVASGRQQTIAKGYFSGVSFSPDSTQLAYSKAPSEKYPPKSDVYAATLASGKSVALTKDHRSASPLWSPNDTIVFDKYLGAKKRRYGPKLDLFLINGEGKGVRRLTHTKVAPLLSGLSPVDWSESGKQLLAEFGGQDTSYAVTVNPRTGKERALTEEREIGFVGAALSRDGSTVLGSVGEFEGNILGRKVLAIPYKGGTPKLLATNASEPDWSR